MIGRWTGVAQRQANRPFRAHMAAVRRPRHPFSLLVEGVRRQIGTCGTIPVGACAGVWSRLKAPASVACQAGRARHPCPFLPCRAWRIQAGETPNEGGWHIAMSTPDTAPGRSLTCLPDPGNPVFSSDEGHSVQGMRCFVTEGCSECGAHCFKNILIDTGQCMFSIDSLIPLFDLGIVTVAI